MRHIYMNIKVRKYDMRSELKVLIAVFIFSLSNWASASLLISPTRVHFDERERSEEIIVVNTSDEIRSYAISWDEKKQGETGGYVKLSEQEAENFNVASKYVRFSPRRLTLAPGQNQRIKLLLRRTSSMPKEDFHSHLKFTLIPSTIAAPPEEPEEVDGISIKMNFFLNYAIPVVVRNHDKPSVLRLSNPKFNPQSSSETYGSINVDVENVSRTYSHGNFTAYYKGSGESEYTAVGFDNAVHVFHETEKMTRNIPIVNPLSSEKGVFKVVFEGLEESKSIPQVSVSLNL